MSVKRSVPVLVAVAGLGSLVVLGLGYALYRGHSTAGLQAEADAKTLGSFSNQVAELRTKLALEMSNRIIGALETGCRQGMSAQACPNSIGIGRPSASSRVVRPRPLLEDACPDRPEAPVSSVSGFSAGVRRQSAGNLLP